MKTVSDLIEFTIKKTKTQWSDIDREFLLEFLNEKRDELVEDIKSHRGEDYFNKDIYHDLINGQYKYTSLLASFGGNLWTNKDPITKISAVSIKYSDNSDYEPAQIRSLFSLPASENYLAENQPESKPIVCLAWKFLYVFPTAKEKTINNWIRLYWLISLPELKFDTDLDDVWWRVIIWEKNILVSALSPMLYEFADNVAGKNEAEGVFEKDRKRFLSRLGRLKEPMERTLPDEEIEKYSN